MISGLIWSLRRGRSLWTNRRCTNLLLSYQFPLRSKGRPGYWRNLELMHMGFCEPRVAKSLVDFLCPLVFPKKCHSSIPEWCASFHIAALIEFSDSIATCHSLNGGCRFVVPTSGPYIYNAFSLLTLIVLIISPVPYRPRASSSLRLLVSSGISSSLP